MGVSSCELPPPAFTLWLVYGHPGLPRVETRFRAKLYRAFPRVIRVTALRPAKYFSICSKQKNTSEMSVALTVRPADYIVLHTKEDLDVTSYRF